MLVVLALLLWGCASETSENLADVETEDTGSSARSSVTPRAPRSSPSARSRPTTTVPSQTAPPRSSTPVTPPDAAATPAPESEVELATGSVPGELVGTWRGGPNDSSSQASGEQSSYALEINEAGQYRWLHEQDSVVATTFEEIGAAFASGPEMVLAPQFSTLSGAAERTVTWELFFSPATVPYEPDVEVLFVIDPILGEFSYVRVA